MNKYKRVVVKIGSNVLSREDQSLDSTQMSALVDQIVELYRCGIEVLVVSSGAVASGRGEIDTSSRKLDPVSARQLFSAIGQAKLIQKYYNLFREYSIVCGQVLTTKESLSTRRHYLNQRECMRVMLDNGVIPIINENDTISVTELMFTDNDELSGLVASMMGADALVILSNVDGIYDGDPKLETSKVIRHITTEHEDLDSCIVSSKSQFGRGGMITKCRISRKVADSGIEVIIANGRRLGILRDLLLGEECDTISTRFSPSSKPMSPLKKWIVHSEGFAKGELHINQGAYKALMQPEASSLLSVGVCRVVGVFEKDDIVTIISPEGNYVGVGRVSVDSTDATAIAGEKGHKPIVHYDYLYME